MRIAYTDPIKGAIVREVTRVVARQPNELECGNLRFVLVNSDIYPGHRAENFIGILLKDGFLDLRPLEYEIVKIY